MIGDDICSLDSLPFGTAEHGADGLNPRTLQHRPCALMPQSTQPSREADFNFDYERTTLDLAHQEGVFLCRLMHAFAGGWGTA